AARRDREIGLEEPRELRRGLVVEDDHRDVALADLPFREAVADRVVGEAGVVLLPGEALLLRGGDDLPVADEGRGGVVVVGRDPKDVHGVVGAGAASSAATTSGTIRSATRRFASSLTWT